MLCDHGAEVIIPRSRVRIGCSAFGDPTAKVGREMTGHTGLTTGPGAIGEAFAPAASMIFGQVETARTTSWPSSSQHSAGS